MLQLRRAGVYLPPQRATKQPDRLFFVYGTQKKVVFYVFFFGGSKPPPYRKRDKRLLRLLKAKHPRIGAWGPMRGNVAYVEKYGNTRPIKRP